jgi:ankyrin repeat protein
MIYKYSHSFILKRIIFLFIIFLTFNPFYLLHAQKNSPFKEGLVVSAVKSGTMEDLIYSIQVGNSSSELDFDEVPALLLAVERGRSDMTLFLLKKGARVNQRDSQKRTALSIAARKNNVSIVNELINFGAKPDRYGANKETPLIIASRFGNFESVIALLEAGAYPDDTDLTGRTALQWSKIKHFKRIEQALKEYGAYDN